jgi:hypothetical protein
MSDQYPQYQQYPQVPQRSSGPKRRHTVRNVFLIIGGIIGVFIVIGIAASVANGGSNTSPAVSGSTASSHQATATAQATHNPVDDVTVGHLDDQGYGMWQVTFTVVNHSSKASDYDIEYIAYDSAGTQVDSGDALVTDVQPGATSLTDWPIEPSGSSSVARVVVKSVDRYQHVS